MKNVFISSYRFYLTFFAVLLTFCTLGGRLLHLQVWQSDKYSELAANARKNFIQERARRGDIVDRKGSLLATTKSVVVVGVDPHAFNENDQGKLKQLAQLLKLDYQTVYESVTKKFTTKGEQKLSPVRWVKLQEGIDESTYKQVKQLHAGGVYGNYQHSRFYPNQQLGAHVLGYVNKEGKACMGIELMADYYLKGQDGWIESERDGRRREMPQFRSVEFLAKDGLNVQLSIDRVIQDSVEEEISNLFEKYSPLSVSIIVSQPATGEILAMANGPTFDPNLFNDFPLETKGTEFLQICMNRARHTKSFQ